MTARYSGGHRITRTSWQGPNALLVEFESSWGELYCHQVYAGRSLMGWTETPAERQLMVPFPTSPNDWPQHISLLAVAPAQRATDYGADLAPRPNNQVKLTWTTSGWAADTRYSEITASPEVDDPVDTSNVIANVLFDANGAFAYVTDPREGTGEHAFEIAGRDATRPDGNRGTPIELTADILAHPPDVAFTEDGYNRFAVEVDSGDLVFSFTEPE